jgi:hypothetical protein
MGGSNPHDKQASRARARDPLPVIVGCNACFGPRQDFKAARRAPTSAETQGQPIGPDRVRDRVHRNLGRSHVPTVGGSGHPFADGCTRYCAICSRPCTRGPSSDSGEEPQATVPATEMPFAVTLAGV